MNKRETIKNIIDKSIEERECEMRWLADKGKWDCICVRCE
jgi:hypothetical protein